MSFWIWYDRLQVLSLGPCLQFEATKMGMWFPEAGHSGSVESLVQKNRLFNQTWSLFCFCSISDPGCLTQRSHNLTQPVEVHWTWDTLGHEFRGLSPCLQQQQTLKHLAVESGSAEVNAGRVSVLLKSFSERKTWVETSEILLNNWTKERFVLEVFKDLNLRRLMRFI